MTTDLIVLEIEPSKALSVFTTEGGLTEANAKLAIVLIASRQVPAVTISY
jgi:hypothetical protein